MASQVMHAFEVNTMTKTAQATDGYTALREDAAWLDLSGRGKIRASGEDRARLLHAMTTNQVEALKPGEGCYAFFLNAQGRILADVNLLCFEDHFLLDTEPETRTKVYEHLDRYIIADDVALEDQTGQIATLAVEGPNAAAALAKLGAPQPAAPYSSKSWNSGTVARLDTTGLGGFFLMIPVEEKQAVISRLAEGGDSRGNRGRRSRRAHRKRPPALRRGDHRTLSGPGNGPVAGGELRQRLLFGPGDRGACPQPRADSSRAAAPGNRHQRTSRRGRQAQVRRRGRSRNRQRGFLPRSGKNRRAGVCAYTVRRAGNESRQRSRTAFPPRRSIPREELSAGGSDDWTSASTGNSNVSPAASTISRPAPSGFPLVG